MGEIAGITPLTLYNGVDALDAPAAYGDAPDITSMQRGHARPGANAHLDALPESALLYIRADDGAVTIPGPVELYAGRDDELYKVGELDGGAAEIVVDALAGFCERVYLGGDWERLALVASGALSGGTVTIELVPEVRI